MDRRALLTLLSQASLLAACGAPGKSVLFGASPSASEVDAEIERRLHETVDYAAVLEGPISKRQPDIAAQIRALLATHPEYLAVLDTLRLHGLRRLRATDLPSGIKMLTLELSFEKVLHEVATCLDHFLGVYELLSQWGLPREEALLGLFHAVYGTEFNKLTILDPGVPANRARLRRLLGDRTEALVYLYGSVDVEPLVCGVAATGRPASAYFDMFRGVTTPFAREGDFVVLANALIANKYEPYVSSQDMKDTLPVLAQGSDVILRELSGAFETLRPYVTAGARFALDQGAAVISS